MFAEERFREYCRTHRIHLTAHRRAVACEVTGLPRQFVVNDVRAALAAKGLYVSLATAHRILQVMQDAGLVRRLNDIWERQKFDDVQPPSMNGLPASGPLRVGHDGADQRVTVRDAANNVTTSVFDAPGNWEEEPADRNCATEFIFANTDYWICKPVLDIPGRRPKGTG